MLINDDMSLNLALFFSINLLDLFNQEQFWNILSLTETKRRMDDLFIKSGESMFALFPLQGRNWGKSGLEVFCHD